ncbi:unnamed protein product [Leuciscus chuanchicus]
MRGFRYRGEDHPLLLCFPQPPQGSVGPRRTTAMLEEGLRLLFTPRMMHHPRDEEAPESPSTNMELQDTHIHSDDAVSSETT